MNGPLFALPGTCCAKSTYLPRTDARDVRRGSRALAVGFAAILFLVLPIILRAQTDCLSCHADKTMQDASGHSVGVDAAKFHASMHGSLGCTDCHTSTKEYPRPGQPAAVKCDTCHADQTSAIGGSIHAKASAHPCTSCHGDAHSIFPKSDARSAVYPLNIPKTCGTCHASETLAKKYGLQNVYATYMDSIHGYAVSKEGLLVAANCMSCHGSHDIKSHKDPASATSRVNTPNTCGTCHGGVKDEYFSGIHGKDIEKGNKKVPVCTDCHTAHAILHPTESSFGLHSPLMCGVCQRDRLASHRDPPHPQGGHEPQIGVD